MIELPNELWMHIASFARREDLTQLALASWLHLAIIRPILAENITLHDRPWLDHNLNLSFLAETGLSRRIRSLSIFDFKKNDVPDIPFANMPNLESLSFSNCGAWTGDRQKTALQSLRESCTGLRSITANSPCSLFPRKNFSLPNVVKVDWHEAGYLTPALFSLCRASLSTIQHLRIWVTAGFHPDGDAPHDGVQTYIRFFDLRFPSLLSLEIGPGDRSLTETGSDDPNGAITKFLLAHPTLQKLAFPHLKIRCRAPIHYISLSISPTGLAGENTLPALRYFEAHPRFILHLLNAEVHFLTAKVETLCISEAFHSTRFPPRNLEQMLNGVDTASIPLLSLLGRLQPQSPHPTHVFAVKNLIVHHATINFCDQQAVAWLSDALMAAASSFPKLESWVGSIPVVPTDLPRLFSKFPRIQSISGSLANQYFIDMGSVFKLAKSCKNLRRIDCLTADRSFIIERQGSGDAERISIRTTNRPEFDEDSPESMFTSINRVVEDHYFAGVDEDSGGDDDDYSDSDADSNYISSDASSGWDAPDSADSPTSTDSDDDSHEGSNSNSDNDSDTLD